MVPSNSSCLEHACTNHPSEMENLSYNHLISLLINADSAVSIFSSVNVCHTVAAFGPSNTVIKLLSQCCFYCLNVYIVHMPSGSLPLLLLLLLLIIKGLRDAINCNPLQKCDPPDNIMLGLRYTCNTYGIN